MRAGTEVGVLVGRLAALKTFQHPSRQCWGFSWGAGDSVGAQLPAKKAESSSFEGGREDEAALLMRLSCSSLA